MAISPVSDLILDVARAADPQKATAASRALAADAPLPSDFSSVMTQTQATVDIGRYAYRNPGPVVSPEKTPAQKAAVGLESVLLKSFVDEMLPKDAADVYGSGVAGDVWRSMLADKIANEMAKSGALKISERLFATHQDLLQTSTVNKIKPSLAPIVPTHTKI
jgi:Rod binding domain-containing protein